MFGNKNEQTGDQKLDNSFDQEDELPYKVVFGWKVRKELKFKQSQYKNASQLAKLNYANFLPIIFFRQFAKTWNVYFFVILLVEFFFIKKAIEIMIFYLASFIFSLLAQIVLDLK